MTEQQLRNAVREAEEKEQLGLLIWSDWAVWNDFAFEVKQYIETYDFALSKISKGEETIVSTKWKGISMPGFFAVSAERLSSSDEYFLHVLNMCKKKNYKGPITLVPLNKISDFC